MNTFPRWKYILVVILIIIGILYALPNLYGDNPAVQISKRSGTSFTTETLDRVNEVLKSKHLVSLGTTYSESKILIRFHDTDTQLKAKEALQEALGQEYIVASNLAPATPAWLLAINATPMKYGLDLQGGVHFLLQVDVDSVIKHRVEGEIRNIGQELRSEKLRYSGFSRLGKTGIKINFRDSDTMLKSQNLLAQKFNNFSWTTQQENGVFYIAGHLSPVELQKIKQNTLEQALMTLRKRVNELGISEPIVQQQGADRISVDLPGVQDTTRAQEILGKTATLEFHMVDITHDVQTAAQGAVPVGSELLYDASQRPVLLKKRIILQGSAITSATSTVDQNGRPSVSVRLGGGGGESTFSRTTAENIGKPMAVVYVDSQPVVKTVDGKKVITYKTERKVINVATIQSALGNQFQITGLENMQYARDLALLLRAGALPTSVAVIESRIVGPSLGKQNIRKGELSVTVGLLIIAAFMLFYYRLFGLIANIGLLFNLVMITAILSMLGLTLTLPAIAGIVLTVGMAIDANVLINERIREEMRNGMSLQASIQAGYERAFATIVDSNVTTLIVAIVLMAIATGAVQGFAVTLTVGILTSMFTAVMVTRGLVNLIYGGRKLQKISIGMK